MSGGARVRSRLSSGRCSRTGYTRRAASSRCGTSTHRATDGSSRLHAAWCLSLYGLRRGEVLGLRWSDIDLKAKPLTVRQARVHVNYKVRIEEPKSDNGKRTLPLDDDLVTALTELRKRQAHESEDAGAAYGAGRADLDWYTEEDKYVVTDELGTPLHPESYSDEFTRMLKRAGLPKIRLHDSRHTLSLLEKAGVPISIIRKWAGPLRARSEGLEPPTF